MNSKVKDIIRTRSLLIQIQTAITDGYWHYTINELDHIIRFGIVQSYKESGTVTAICFARWRLMIARCTKDYQFKKKCDHYWEEDPELPDDVIRGAYGTIRCTKCGKIERCNYPVGHLKHGWE